MVSEFKLKKEISLRSEISTIYLKIKFAGKPKRNELSVDSTGKFYTKDGYKMKKLTGDSNVNIRIKLSAYWRA